MPSAVADPAPAPAAPADPETAVDEIAGAARLVGALVDTLVGPIQDTHEGIVHRVVAGLGPVGTPVRVVHDAATGAAYGAVRGGARLAGGAAGAVVAAAGGGRDRRPISAHPRGAQALAFGSGLLGDWMDGRTDDLVVRLTVCHHGEPLPTEPAALVGALDAPTDRIVVFVHGLAETPASWGWWPTDDEGQAVPTYGERLAEVGWTPLEVGYNTGLPVTTSAEELAELIEGLVAAWPGPVAEVALVGHSMGGLVAGAACHRGLATGAGWVDHVSHVVTLGTPHAGSWLARLAHRGASTFGRLPETRGLASFLDLRSAGIRDLTRGRRPAALGEGGGDDADEEADVEAEIVTLAALMPRARHAFVASSLGAGRRHPVAWLVGDGLVHPRSATAPARAARDAPNVVVRHHSRVGHLRLVHHPAVADDLVTWMGPRR
ncbi:hypothetical protein HC251_01465 [Iamia sp. SCSIO 61187]|uniref:esterase/lipase family protein n=1 Tax=Iamia sp. SCSIO 61187 TaxID=2722752 RepID=UPI001C625E2B|nr:hypothetical protein [Iamia sp. SCSIO 61187]QYG91235.1 hypothetical protein HC251_01465 [Iamia sp. SCSIO 61187]